jgi:hypothetical protein
MEWNEPAGASSDRFQKINRPDELPAVATQQSSHAATPCFESSPRLRMQADTSAVSTTQIAQVGFLN